MLKRLLLTAALLSSTYGAEVEYFDPDFSLLAKRSEKLVVNETGATINLDKSESWVLRRLTQAEVTEVLNSSDLNMLYNILVDYIEDLSSIRMIYVAITADSIPRNGYSKDQDAEFLRQLFWSRIELLEQTAQAMLLSPDITTEEPTVVLKEHHKKIAAFSKEYDHTDTSPFYKAAYAKNEKLFHDFLDTSNVQQLTPSTNE